MERLFRTSLIAGWCLAVPLWGCELPEGLDGGADSGIGTLLDAGTDSGVDDAGADSGLLDAGPDAGSTDSGVVIASAATYPTGLTVRGSVGQVYVLNALPNSAVTLAGGPGIGSTSATTNDGGAALIRNVTPGSGYTLTVNGAGFPVTVLTGHGDAVTYADGAAGPADHFIETRDGTLLAYRVDFPTPPAPGKKFDVTVLYEGYRPALRPSEPWEEDLRTLLLAKGYAVVGVNMRGSGCSGGAFDVMEHLVALDGYDVVEALHAQNWVDDIAFVGASWLGLSQLFVAATKPPNLAAIAPGAVVADFYRDVVYPGGILNSGFAVGWAHGRDTTNAFPSAYGTEAERGTGPWKLTDQQLAARILPTTPGSICQKNQALRSFNKIAAADWQSHSLYDDYWATRTVDAGQISVPTLLVNSWQDEQVGGRPGRLIDAIPLTTPARLIGTNGIHAAYLGGDVWAEVVRFLDVYLNDVNPVETVATYQQRPRVEILLRTNPLIKSPARLSLGSMNDALARRFELGSQLSADAPDAPDSGVSTFQYTPGPAGEGWATPVQDQVRFTSASPLANDIVMAGSGSVDLWVRTSATDVDLQVTLSDVRTDGQEQLIQSGWLRAGQRALGLNSSVLRPIQLHASSSPLLPNTWTKVRVELFPFAHVFKAGSRIRLIVSGPEGGGQAWLWNWSALPGGFNVSIGHDLSYPSSIVLPEIANPQVSGTILGLASCTETVSQPCRTTQ